MGIRQVYVDYNSIALQLDALADKIRMRSFSGIVIILRGGSFVGMHTAFLTGLPYYFIRYDRDTRVPKWIGNAPIHGARVLLCEDFAGAGWTLIDCRDFLESAGYDVQTLVVCQDRLSASKPDFCCFDGKVNDEKYVLPWERHILAVTKFDGRQDHEYERVAWDLDGVFISEVRGYHYATDLQAALEMRDHLPKAPFAPNVSLQDMIVTGRPKCDKVRTEKWLRDHQIQIPVVFRDDGVQNPTKESTARWKGKRALELGCTHFVESDAAQSLHIASLYPELRVIWWNEGDPLTIKAALTPCSHRPQMKHERI
jgi:hypoxanthine phosphoribosyltransferase